MAHKFLITCLKMGCMNSVDQKIALKGALFLCPNVLSF